MVHTAEFARRGTPETGSDAGPWGLSASLPLSAAFRGIVTVHSEERSADWYTREGTRQPPRNLKIVKVNNFNASRTQGESVTFAGRRAQSNGHGYGERRDLTCKSRGTERGSPKLINSSCDNVTFVLENCRGFFIYIMRIKTVSRICAFNAAAHFRDGISIQNKNDGKKAHRVKKDKGFLYYEYLVCLRTCQDNLFASQ